MKTQLRKLNLMIALGVINPDDFYVISIWEDVIILQGKILKVPRKTTKLFKDYDNWGETKDLMARRNDIQIVLTN